MRDLAPSPGVVPFSIHAEPWLDHATAQRLLGLPGTSKARFYDAPVDLTGDFFSTQVVFPKDGVLAKTLSLEMERGVPTSSLRLETQILHFDGLLWRGYTYAWNDQQTDANLVPAKGLEKNLVVIDRKAPGGKRTQTWHFPSRTECLLCHNPWTGFTLAFTPAQTNKEHRYDGVTENQIHALTQAGYLSLHHKENKIDGPWHGPLPDYLVSPGDARKSLEQRARSYLHVNCSHCHQWGGGGTADLDLRATTSLDDGKTLEARPVQGTFDIPDVQILAPGDPYRSVLYYRMARTGPGHMPHLGSEIVDENGLKLIHDWIRQLPIRKNDRALLNRLLNLEEAVIAAAEKSDYSRQLKELARNLAQDAGRNEPSKDDWAKASETIKKQATQRALERSKERPDLIQKLLSTPSSSLMLLAAFDGDRLPAGIRSLVLDAVTRHPNPQVRDLFERFLPEEQRTKRLGAHIPPEKILARRGNADRGKELFFKTEGPKCASCHRVNGAGSTLGPDLSQIAQKTRARENPGEHPGTFQGNRSQIRHLCGGDGRRACPQRHPGGANGA
jgi:mono/diheme cytochrome c family protein